MPASVFVSPNPTSLTKVLLRRILPLSVRKAAAVWVGRQEWISGRDWWSAELVRDLANADIAAYHEFLWSNHLGYAKTYEVEERFGQEHIHPTRKMLFEELADVLREKGLEPERDIRSVYEVGCSMGYLLHHLQAGLFRSAPILWGSDIDEYAIRTGRSYLAARGSRVELQLGDMRDLDRLMGSRRFDVILCAGVLMYLPAEEAAAVVEAIIRHSSGVVAFAGLAHPEQDNATLTESVPRARDGSLIHNIDAFVARAGGRVIRRLWEGSRTVAGNTVYFVFCIPDLCEVSS